MLFIDLVHEANELIQYIRYAIIYDNLYYDCKVNAKKRQLRFVYRNLVHICPEFAGLHVVREYLPVETTHTTNTS